MKVLVVEDNDLVASFMEDAIKLLGHEVVTAVDGIDGIMKFNEHMSSIGLVITDYKMPHTNGAVLMYHCKMQRPSIPIVMSSGYTEDYSIYDPISIRPDWFLPKPVSLYTLKTVLAAAEKNMQSQASINSELRSTAATRLT